MRRLVFLSKKEKQNPAQILSPPTAHPYLFVIVTLKRKQTEPSIRWTHHQSIIIMKTWIGGQ